MVDTWSISNDERWSVVSLSFLESLESLSLVSSHCNLSYIYIAVSCSNHTKILLANALTRSSELSDSTEWCCLRRLTTSIRINLSIDYEDVNVFARSNHMVETSVADVVRSTVTTDDPLAALNEVILVSENLLASVTTTSLTSSYNLRSESLGLSSILLILDPLLHQCLEFSRAASARLSLGHETSETLLHLLVGNSHTETEFAEVLEE